MLQVDWFLGTRLIFDISWLRSPTHLALYGFIAIMIGLLVIMVVHRSTLTLLGEKKANEFDPSGRDISPFAHRLSRAHANCYESFPVWGGLMILAISSGGTTTTDPLALYFLAARLGQTITHLVSTNEKAVLVRFGFFVIQIVIAIWWLVALGHRWFT